MTEEMENPAGGTSGAVRATGNENDTASVADAASADKTMGTDIDGFLAEVLIAARTVKAARRDLLQAADTYTAFQEQDRKAVKALNVATNRLHAEISKLAGSPLTGELP